MADFVKVCEKADVPEGEGKVFDVSGTPIAVFNCEGEFKAISNTCPHQGGPLGEGELNGCVVTCPWHQWKFDVKTGVSVVDSSVSVPKYEVKVEGEDVLVRVE